MLTFMKESVNIKVDGGKECVKRIRKDIFLSKVSQHERVGRKSI